MGLHTDLKYERKKIDATVSTSESIVTYKSSKDDYEKIINYYDRLDNENKEFITGKMIELYKDQQKSIKYVDQMETDADILKELESYRLELESKKKLSMQNRNIK